MAAMSVNADILNFILQKAPEVDGASNDGITALHSTAVLGHDVQVQALLENGASPNLVSTIDGWTALHYAATGRSKAVLEHLLRGGANVNSTTETASTALQAAVERDDMDSVRLLLDSGARMDLRQSDGSSAFDLAAAGGNKEIIQLLFKAETARLSPVTKQTAQ